MDYHKIILVGNTTKDAEVREGEGKTAYADLTLAVSRNKEQRTFFPVRLFGKLAEACRDVKKGAKLLVDGRLEISDFLDRRYEHQMKAVGGRHDLIAVSLSDPREYELPRVGFIELEDAETGQRFLLDTDSTGVRDAYRAVWTEKAEALRNLCTSSGIDHIGITAGADYVRPLTRFFLEREKRFKIRSG